MSYADSWQSISFWMEMFIISKDIIIYVFIQLAIKIATITSVMTAMSWEWIHIMINNTVIQRDLRPQTLIWLKGILLFYFLLFFPIKFISCLTVAWMCFPHFSVDLHWTISSFYPLRPSSAFIQLLFIHQILLEADQKYTEEELPDFILESQANFREEVVFALSLEEWVGVG